MSATSWSAEARTRALLAAWNSHDAAAVAAFYDESASRRNVVAPEHNAEGLAAIRRFIESFYEAFPDAHFQVESVVAHGNRSTVEWTISGTHLGTYASFRGTGRKVSVVTTSDIEFDATGQIIDESVRWDLIAFLSQLGLMGSDADQLGPEPPVSGD